MPNCSCKLRYFGSFAILDDAGNDITPRASKARGLLAILGEKPGRRFSRRWLESKLWSDRAPKQASGSLRQSLSEIRAALGDNAEVMQTSRLDVWLDAELTSTDLESGGTGGLLEGMDVRDPEFEDWLRVVRQKYESDEIPNLVTTSSPLGVRILSEVKGDGSEVNKLAAKILADQIGKNFEDRMGAWRLAETESRSIGDLTVECEVAQDGGAVVIFVRVVHAKSGKVIFSGFRQPEQQGNAAVSAEFIAEFAHNAVNRALARLPAAAGLDIPQFIAVGFCNLALEGLKKFQNDELIRAEQLLTRAYEADPNGVYLAWRSFVQMAQVVETSTDPDATGFSATDELMRKALETSPDNAQTLSLVSMARAMMFDDLNSAQDLARSALAINSGNLLARQSMAVVHGASGDLEQAYAQSQFCQPAMHREDLRHIWDLYHSLVCISTGRLDEAIAAAERAAALCPNFLAPKRQLLALYANRGEIEKARKQVAVLEKLEPKFTLDRFISDPRYPNTTLRNASLLDLPSDIAG